MVSLLLDVSLDDRIKTIESRELAERYGRGAIAKKVSGALGSEFGNNAKNNKDAGLAQLKKLKMLKIYKQYGRGPKADAVISALKSEGRL